MKGRRECRVCGGDGEIVVPFEDINVDWAPCPECHGNRVTPLRHYVGKQQTRGN
jgi:excinuclease UvrABC ATPase subunit